MKVDIYGRTIVTPEEVFESLYSGKISNLENLYFENEAVIDQFNRSVKENADHIPKPQLYASANDYDSVELFDESNRCDWFMPDEYNNFPMDIWLHDQCKTEAEHARVDEELVLFIQHGVYDVLFYLKYLVDTMRKNNIVWGVGRGSSVSSYILFLLGVHKIDSIKYNLDIKEFLK